MTGKNGFYNNFKNFLFWHVFHNKIQTKFKKKNKVKMPRRKKVKVEKYDHDCCICKSKVYNPIALCFPTEQNNFKCGMDHSMCYECYVRMVVSKTTLRTTSGLLETEKIIHPLRCSQSVESAIMHVSDLKGYYSNQGEPGYFNFLKDLPVVEISCPFGCNFLFDVKGLSCSEIRSSILLHLKDVDIEHEIKCIKCDATLKSYGELMSHIKCHKFVETYQIQGANEFLSNNFNFLPMVQEMLDRMENRMQEMAREEEINQILSPFELPPRI
jgi:hypothetical protein